MLLLTAVACVTGRSAVIRVVAIVGLVLFVLSLGSSLTVHQQDLQVWLPWRLVGDVPLLSLAQPGRLQIFVAACAAVVVGLWVDRLGDLPRRGWRIAGAVLAAAAVASWLPAGGVGTSAATSPTFFRTAEEHVQVTDVAVTYPRPSGAWVGGALPVLWQAHSRMAYRMTGGGFLSSDALHPVLYETPENLFEGACRGLLEGLPPPDDAYTAAARQQLEDLGVTVVLVVPQSGADYTPVGQWAERVAGAPGEQSGGVWLYRLRRT